MTSFITPRSLAALTAVLAAGALLPAAATAGTVTYEGDTLVLRAAPGEANDVTLSSEEPGRLSISDAATHTLPTDRCAQEDPQYAITCDVPAAVRVELADGEDRLVVSHTAPAGLAVTGLGGDGRDDMKAIDGQTRNTFDGGAGGDTLRSEGGNDVLRGGAGDDRLLGLGGDDVLEGGDGDDTLTGDGCENPGADVLDGGAGHDLLTDWGDCGPGSDRRPVTVTVDGRADDGRPGEGDDVRDLDHLQLFVPATVVGGDRPESIEIFAPADAQTSSVQGRGGADTLRAGSGRESLDGGAGDDRIEGGFGDDTLTGGPGRDVIHGDSTAAQCGGNGQSCTIPFGNDTILARDGEADSITCGPGHDRAVVDAADVVAADCETVERGAAGGSGGDGGGGGGGATTPRMTVTATRLSSALRSGLTVRLTGLRPGAVTVLARHAGRVVARGTGTVGARGTATVRVRFTAGARRSLARRATVRLSVRARGVTRTLIIRRSFPTSRSLSR